MKKSSPEEIRQKFNLLVDSYSDLEAGQRTAVDSVKIAKLIAKVAICINSGATEILDIGCGGGNYAIRLLAYLPDANVTLVDLSEKMLERAAERIASISKGKITRIWGDIRNILLPENRFDIIVAGTSLHHLRIDSEWNDVFTGIYSSLKPGGSFWISDMIKHDNKEVHQVLKENYSEYLVRNIGAELKDWVFEQMQIEDSPRSLNYQIELLQKTGFRNIEILHKNMIFAAFGGIK